MIHIELILCFGDGFDHSMNLLLLFFKNMYYIINKINFGGQSDYMLLQIKN